MTIPFRKAQKRLVTIWFIGAGIFLLWFLFLILRPGAAFSGEETAPRASEWIVALIVPTLGLMVASFVADVRGRVADHRRADQMLYRLSAGASLFYLGMIAIIVLFQVATPADPQRVVTELAAFEKSRILLHAMQALLSGLLAYFFVTQSAEP